MAPQPVQKEKPEAGPTGHSGFLRFVPPPVWMAPPATSFETFDIHNPHFYMINGRPMAFVGVRP